jgi:hypothetical protein
MTGYLFVHFIGDEKDGEQIYFSLSQDGLQWNDLNDGKPVLFSHIGEKGVRDPFLIKDEIKKKYYLLATDLRIGLGKDWDIAQYNGSKNLIIWESEDLVHWNSERSVAIGIDEAGCVWAPEAIYDKEKGAFLVFFASMVKLPGDEKPKQRIYASYTQDFETFTDPFVYIERSNHVIDTTIIFNGEKYYRFSKDETTKRIRMETSETLDKEGFSIVDSATLNRLVGVEGPEIYQLPDGNWCLIVDQFAEGKGYLPLVSNDLSKGEFQILTEDKYYMGKTKKRHGGVIQLTEEEYQRVFYAYSV